MEIKKDIKPILNWAVGNGEAKIIDRILMKLLPHFLKDGLKITEKTIVDSNSLEVSPELYILVKNTAEELIGSSFVE